jgi:hypothetical protein
MEMNEHQRDLRQAAEEAFKESLERLQQSLLCPEEEVEAETPPEVLPPIAPQQQPERAATAISLDELEDAVKDIEQFLSHQDIAQGKLL